VNKDIGLEGMEGEEVGFESRRKGMRVRDCERREEKEKEKQGIEI
jgi:hypothetical protein